MQTDVTNIKRNSTLRLTYCGLLIAVSAVGALIKIQGSIAFDSLPGFFAALFLGPGYGALVAGLGHGLTALTSGFPLTLPMHLVVGLEMALFGFIFGWVYRKSNVIIAAIIAVLLNGPLAALLTVPFSQLLRLPFNGWPLFYVIIVPLTVASLANVVLACSVYKFIFQTKN